MEFCDLYVEFSINKLYWNECNNRHYELGKEEITVSEKKLVTE